MKHLGGVGKAEGQGQSIIFYEVIKLSTLAWIALSVYCTLGLDYKFSNRDHKSVHYFHF